jgi:hypothetical protein
MAIVTKSYTGKDGAMVDVLYFLGKPNDTGLEGDDYWAIAHRGELCNAKGEYWMCRDIYMIPIRPGELDDSQEGRKVLEFTE